MGKYLELFVLRGSMLLVLVGFGQFFYVMLPYGYQFSLGSGWE